jgi:hypothetical protein
MKRTINSRGNSKRLGKYSSLISLSMSHDEDKNQKTMEEWIYGKVNENGNNTIINFKSQKAFKGYKRNKVDLYKLFFI